MKFSKTTRGFYALDLLPDYFAAGTLPADLEDISPADHAALMAAQAVGKIIDWSGPTPVAVDPPPESREAAIERIDTAIKAERDRRKVGGMLVSGKWFQTDADSCIQFLGLKDRARDVLIAGGAFTDMVKVLGQPVPWRTMDGTYAPITVQLAFDVVTAKGDTDAMLFKVCETHRAAMKASASPATYDFSGGWPAVYQG